jgi:hypothetical protein
MHADKMHVFWTTRNVGHTNSTPANPNQNQELSIEFKGVSTVKVTQPVPTARELELSWVGGWPEEYIKIGRTPRKKEKGVASP